MTIVSAKPTRKGVNVRIMGKIHAPAPTHIKSRVTGRMIRLSDVKRTGVVIHGRLATHAERQAKGIF